MVAPGFLPVPQLLPGSHHGGLRSSAGRPRPPLPALARQPPALLPAPARLPLAQSLRSGASLPGERPGEAPGSCSGSLSLPRPELRRRERAGKPRRGGRGAGEGGRRGRGCSARPPAGPGGGSLRRPLPSGGAGAGIWGRGSETPSPRRAWGLEPGGPSAAPAPVGPPCCRRAARPLPACAHPSRRCR